MRIAIIGAGIVGSSIAYHLSQSGANVYIFDANRVGSGTSQATFSYLNAVRFGGGFGELRVKAIDYWTDLSRELGAEQFLHRDGSVYYIDNLVDAEKMEAHVAASSAAGLPVERMSGSQFVVKYEPNLIFPESPFPIYRMPTEGWLEVVPIIGKLLLAAESAGAVVVSGGRITRIRSEGAAYRIKGEATDVLVDRVVLCGGPETQNLLELFGTALPVETRAGVTIVTKPLPIGLRHVVYAGKVHFKPDGGGRLVAGRTDYRSSLPTPETARQAGEETAALVRPWLRNFGRDEIEAVRIGVRPIPGDGLPMVGAIPGHPRVSVAVMHSGISLGGLIGREHAREILSGVQSSMLADYRPERMLGDVALRDNFAPWAPGDLTARNKTAIASAQTDQMEVAK